MFEPESFSDNLDQITQNAQQTMTGATQSMQGTVGNATQSMQEGIQNAADDVSDAADQAAQQAQQAADQAAQEAQQAVEEAEQAAADAAEQAEQAAADAVEQAEQAAADAVEQAEQAAADAAEQAGQAASEAAEQAQQAANEAAEQAQQAVDDAAEQAQQAVDEATEQAQQAVDEAAEQAQAVVDEAAAQAQEAVDQAAEEAQAAMDEASEAAQAQVEAAQEAANQAVQEAQAAANEAIEQAQTEFQNGAEAVQNEMNDAIVAAQEEFDNAVAAAEGAVSEAAEALQNQVQAAAAAAGAALAALQEEIGAALGAAAEAVAGAMEDASAMAAEAMAAAQEALSEAAQAAEEALAGATEALQDALGDVFGDDSGQQSGGELLPQFFVKIDGSLVSQDLMDDVIEIEVEDNLHLPDMFTIHLHDSALKWADTFGIGKVIDISAQAAKQPWRGTTGQTVPLIQGEITGLEPDMVDSGVPTLMVRGYDRAHRLHEGRQTRSFLNSTDSEIVQKIAREVGLKADVTPTSVIHEHVTQNNQTNMEFLQARAKRIGYQLYVENDTLHFHPGDRDEGSGPELEWGKNLISFQPSLTSTHQVDEVIVRGWDPMTKREIEGRSSNSNSMPQVPGQAQVDQGFKGSNQKVVSYPVKTQQEADAMAQAIRDEMGGELIQAEGLCLGNPEVKAGKKVKIVGMGNRSGQKQFDGEYFVTMASHTYHAEEGYETRFSIGGRKPDTLSALLAPKDDKENDPGRGVRVGLVTNNKDPENLGRIKVKYPGVDDTDESPWVRIATPMGGAERGWYYLPEINDEVLVAFEQGDIHRPYMLGMLWNGSDKPPKPNSEVVGGDGKVNQRILRSRSGHEVVLDDTSGQEKVTVTTKGEHQIILDDGNRKITVSDKSGNQIVINSQDNSLKIDVKGNLSIKAGGKLDIESSGPMTIKGATIDLN